MVLAMEVSQLVKKHRFLTDKQLMQLSLAYIFAAGLIAGLALLARRNQRQGWRKKRGMWRGVQLGVEEGALEAREDAPQPYAPLEHLGDIDRLQQVLVALGEPQSELVEAVRKEDFARAIESSCSI
jgi:hypothetical protein